jgi:DNA-binding NarL/FixJ family response regulator
MQILIVDDEPGTRLATAAAVERLGHTATQAADAEEALRAYAAELPDVVVTDWEMPGMDGTELVARIRAHRAPGYTYVLLLSGRAGEDAAREAVRAGADGVLAKPLDTAALERGLIAAARLVALHRRMLDDARYDPETGAGSPLRLVEDLRALCARVERYGHVYCLAMVGLDPEAAGAAGVALADAIRSGDALYRYGPGEFVVLLPEQALETAAVAGERLRLAAEAAAPGVSVSAGVVTTAGAECDPDSLLALAAEALAKASASGGAVVEQEPADALLRLLIADDDPVSRLTIGALLKREPGFELVGEAGDATEAVELALRRRPDVVLLDVDMPGGGGPRAAVQIREALPDARIVAISADDSQQSQYDMMRAGAVGFLAKGAPDEEILRVIRSSARW